MTHLSYIKNSGKLTKAFFCLFAMTLTVSCDFEYELPEAGSIADLTAPMASFSASQSEDNYLSYSFSNLSSSAINFEWNLGDGTTSTSKDVTNTYEAEGSYTVTLIVSDALGVNSSISKVISIVKPPAPAAKVPTILEASFEDNTLPDGTGDGRDSWKNDFGGIIQITSSPVQDGKQAAKFPSAGDRVAYQSGLEVTPNTDYVITYYYTIKTSPEGSITLNVLGGTIGSLSEVSSKSLASHVGTDQTDENTYVKVDLEFNSGANDAISLLITNEGSESRLDNVSIDLK